ncbi:hypothetical protein FOA52_011664 [Chlamydomonas sp. UWO 241]|nr:hypothetical protein FOA52_011664 [Chlamydomonas sp. UWO 241]
MPLLNARKEPIWRLWPPARSVAVERAGELATMDLWDALASFAEGGGMPRGSLSLVTHAQAGANTPKVQPVGCYSWCCSATQVIKYLIVFPTGTGMLGSLACVGSTSSIVSWLY